MCASNGSLAARPSLDSAILSQCIAQQREQGERCPPVPASAEALGKASPRPSNPEVFLRNPACGSAWVSVPLSHAGRNSFRPTRSCRDAADAAGRRESVSCWGPALQNLFLMPAYLNNT